jgi:hypothetical protein
MAACSAYPQMEGVFLIGISGVFVIGSTQREYGPTGLARTTKGSTLKEAPYIQGPQLQGGI